MPADKPWYREALDAAAVNASTPARRDAFTLGADAIDLVRDLLVEVLEGGALVDVARFEALYPRIHPGKPIPVQRNEVESESRP